MTSSSGTPSTTTDLSEPLRHASAGNVRLKVDGPDSKGSAANKHPMGSSSPIREILRPLRRPSGAPRRSSSFVSPMGLSSYFPQNEYETLVEVFTLLLVVGTIWNYWTMMSLLSRTSRDF